MADNVPITAGSGTSIATDEVGVNGGTTAHAQFVKLVDGTSNGTDGIPGTTQGLYTVPHRDVVRVAVTSSGLTTATTAYSAGDQVGTQFTFTTAARASGGTGKVVGAVLLDESDIIGAYDLVLTRASITLAADNAAYAISDSDAAQIVGLVQLGSVYDLTNNRIAVAPNISIPYDCSGGTSLYGGLICRVGHTFFGATTALKLTLFLERD